MKIPKNLYEAFLALDKILNKDDVRYIKNNGVISVHRTLGMSLRNQWGLWHNSVLAKNLKDEYKINHPDDMSHFILESYVKNR